MPSSPFLTPPFTTSEDTPPSEEVPQKCSNFSQLRKHRTLVLNHNLEPMGYPLETMNFEDIIHGMVLDRFEVIEWSPLWAHAPSQSIRLPSIVALKEFVPQRILPRIPYCNLHNLFVRDQGICQYTGVALTMHNTDNPAREATLEHLRPQVRGGQTVWENVLLVSSTSNNEKGCQLLWQTRFRPLHSPWVPTHQDLLYLWLTKYQVSEAEEPWMEFLRLVKPSNHVQRVIENVAKLAA